jgi:hypothetical protein
VHHPSSPSLLRPRQPLALQGEGVGQDREDWVDVRTSFVNVWEGFTAGSEKDVEIERGAEVVDKVVVMLMEDLDGRLADSFVGTAVLLSR